jgi:hypothetical protein
MAESSLGSCPEFFHAESGLTRFPPNVERISIIRESSRTWLVTRRNDIELRFPLRAQDAAHLAALLTSPAIEAAQ